MKKLIPAVFLFLCVGCAAAALALDIQGNLTVKGRLTFLRDLVHSDTYPIVFSFETASDTRTITVPDLSGEITLMGQVIRITDLTGVDTIAGQAGKYAKVKVDESGIEWAVGGGAAAFTDLTDVTDYAGHGGEYVKVKADASGLEYGTPAGDGLPSGTQGDILYFDTDAWKVLGAGTAGDYLASGGPAANPSWSDSLRVASFGITVDGAGSEIADGSKGYVTIPYACTPKSWTILADQSGSINISVKKASYGDFPTMTDIVGTETPLVSSAQKNQDTSLTTWTSISAGDTIEFYVNSCTDITRFNLVIQVER